MSADAISRRNFLRLSAMTGASVALVACAPGLTPAAQAPAAGAGAAAANAGGYQGKFVIFSLATPDQNEPLIKAIEAANPGVTVEWRGLTSERYTELFAAADVANDQIDIMDLNGQDLRRYALGGKLQDLSDLPYLDRFRDIGVQTYTVNGKLWATPRGGITGFPFLYNKKALDKIGLTKEPETYAELLQIAPELKKAGYAPFVHAGKNIYLWPIWQFFAFAQTTGNKALDMTFKTLAGDMKFTDPEHVAALEILNRYAQDGMFIDGVNSLDSDGAWLAFSQGKGAFWYEHSWRIGLFRKDTYPELDLSLIPPVRSVDDSKILRQLPGGTGDATGIYARIAPERQEVARNILDLMTSDEWVKWRNDRDGDPVSTNQNVTASEDPLAVKYDKECSANQFTYLDWFWPPEITRAFQENQQAIVTALKTPEEAAGAIQKVMDGLYADGYKFEM